jgi:5'-nucleotidase
MRILVTNDDGIAAAGLAVAEAIAAEIAGPDGEVWTVAPAFEQSGVAHAVSYVRPMRLERLEARRFAVEGSPADCVLAGLHEIMKESPPDLVLSGVNRGHNVAEDTLYSGTVGGAMEAALHRVRAVALSQYHGPATLESGDPFAAARAHGAAVLRRLIDGPAWPPAPYGVFYNVNFPPVAAEAVRGMRATFQGYRANPTFGVLPHVAPNGRTFLWLTHGHGNADSPPGSDSRESHDGYITVTPLNADLTAHDLIAPLAQALA